MKPIRSITKVMAVAALGIISATTFAHSDGDHGNYDAKGQGMGMAHHHMMHDRPFLRVVHQLNLTDEQRTQIKDIIARSDAQAKQEWSQHKDELSGLMNPGDPNYAGAVKAAEDAAVAHIEKRSQDNLAIYNLLTAEQKAKLPQVIEHMKQRMQEHHDQKQQRSSSSGSK
jgi:Spy/CpxP family protein refolding chaperone